LAKQADLGDVVEVRVNASPLFSPEALQQAWEMLVRETALAGSRLVVEELAMTRQCPHCGSAWQVSRNDVTGHLVVCPSCGAVSGIGGREGLEVLEVVRSEA
jgi:Zn finger protein HypA/HybF involved in hydrogenase expression